MLQAVIIDDELGARDFLKHAIGQTNANINIIGEAEDAINGITLIKELKPNLVFLDVEMPGGSGLDMLGAMQNINFKIIFTTAFSEYAIKAIKYSALDYLLKPIDVDELSIALRTASNAITPTINPIQITNLKQNLTGEKLFNKISLNSQEEIFVTDVNDILYLKAINSYTEFNLIQSKPKLITKTLLHFDGLLEDHNFFRCHRSYLINMNHVQSFSKEDGGMAVLYNNTKVPIASRRKNEFLELMK